MRNPNVNTPMVLFVHPNSVRLNASASSQVHTASVGCYHEPWREYNSPVAVIRGTESSDYSGGARERSNHRTLLANEDIAPHVIRLVGSHGYQALAYDASLGPVPLCAPLADVIDQLHDGEAVDEDDEIALESELEREAWEPDGRRDFRRAVLPLLDLADPSHEHEDDNMSNAPVDELWHGGCEMLNVNGGLGCTIEQGCTVYFHIRAWLAAAERAIRNPHPSGGESARFVLLIQEFAATCRTPAAR